METHSYNVPLHCRSEEHLVGVMASGGDWGAEKMGVCGAWTLLLDMDKVRYGYGDMSESKRLGCRAAFKKEIEGRPSTRSIGDLPPEVLNFTVCYAKTL